MILPKLEIFGLTKAQEEAIFACLLSGEPCLLMGPPGTAKTEIIAAIGAALREDSKNENPSDPSKWFSYQIYDASKLNFEDLTGFPNIEKLKQGSIEYISSPSSIWNKHLIAFDELNRCAEDRQGNLLEIIRSRKLCGVPTGNKFVFSTINPFGDAGTVEMADPLVDRNLFFIKFDKFEEMNSNNRTKVMLRAGSVDGVGLKYWGGQTGKFDTSDYIDPKTGRAAYINESLAAIGKQIREKMTQAEEYYRKLSASSSKAIASLIDKVVAAFKTEFDKEQESVKKEVSLSGRRCGFVLRGILAIRAIQLASKEENENLEDFSVVIANAMKLALPIGIGGKANKQIIDRANVKLEETVKTYWPTIKKMENGEDINLIAEALNNNNPIRMLDVLLSLDMPMATKDAILGSLTAKEKYKINNGTNENLFNFTQALLYALNRQIPGFIPNHIKINCTAAEADAASQVKKIPLDHLTPYEDFIVAMMKEYNNNPIINLGIRGALHYMIPNKTLTEADIIKNLVDMKKMLASIYAKINVHSNGNTSTTPTKDTKEGS